MKEGRTYGNAWMHRTLVWLLKHINIRLCYVFMAIFVVPFTLLFSPGARIIFRYYHNKKEYGWLRSLWSTYRNHVIFGQTVIDKFAMYAGRQFKIAYQGLDQYKELTGKPEAFIQLSAHIGCSEIIGYSFDNSKASNVLVYGGEKSELMKLRKQAFGNRNMKIIPVGADEGHSEDIIRALEKGEIIYAFADRFMNEKKIIITRLFDHHLKLAKGPFSLAVTRGLNVIMTSALKESNGSYTAYLTPLNYDKTLSIREQRQQLADAYVAEIERLLKMYPLQWFNFSDPWID